MIGGIVLLPMAQKLVRSALLFGRRVSAAAAAAATVACDDDDGFGFQRFVAQHTVQLFLAPAARDQTENIRVFRLEPRYGGRRGGGRWASVFRRQRCFVAIVTRQRCVVG